MSDQQITCGDCGEIFVFTAAEQSFYEEKGLAVPPKRCRACRQARKAGSQGRGASGGHGGGGGNGGNGRRYSGDVNEYRSPMTGGVDDWSARRPSYGGGGYGNGGGNGVGGGNGGGAPRGPRREGGGWGEYRSPAFPEMRDDSRSRGPAPRGQGRFGSNNGPAPANGGRGPQHGRGNGDFARPRSEHNAPARPRFDITCGQCGAQAQVPFKPLEGRQVFCQDCYRARRATAREGVERMDVRDTDTGIVE